MRHSGHLDRRRVGRYKVALFSAVVAMLLGPAVALGKDLIVKGAILPPGSQQVGEARYRSPSAYPETIKFFEKQYKGNPRKTIINQPGIRAVHIVNDGRGEWEGLNVYELENETRIFVVSRDPVPAPSKASPTGGRPPRGER